MPNIFQFWGSRNSYMRNMGSPSWLLIVRKRFCIEFVGLVSV